MSKTARRTFLGWMATAPFAVQTFAKTMLTKSNDDAHLLAAPPLQALNVVRAFGTLEANYKHKFGTYASRSELLDWNRGITPKPHTGPAMAKNYLSGPQIDLESKSILEGWDLHFHVAPEKAGYLLIMASPEKVIACGDPGAIYHGKLPNGSIPDEYVPVKELALLGLNPYRLRQGLSNPQANRALAAIRRVAFMSLNVTMVEGCGGACWDNREGVCWLTGDPGCLWCCFPYASNCCLDAATNGVPGGCRCSDDAGCRCFGTIT